METSPSPKDTKESDNVSNSEDQETMELYSQARAKEREIMLLREQIARASIKESQMLNEKLALERKFSELRMALDEKQSEAIVSASNELHRRKVDLDENLRLINELKIAEDEKYIFMSSLLGLLGEYGIWPRVTNASALSDSIKHLHDQLQLKIKTSHDRIAELHGFAQKHSGNRYPNKDTRGSDSVSDQFPSISMGVHGYGTQDHYVESPYTKPVDNVPRYTQDNGRPHLDSAMMNHDTRQLLNDDKRLSNSNRGIAGSEVDDIFDRSGIHMRQEEMAGEQYYSSPAMQDRVGSFDFEDEGPGIEGFQIMGEAEPGGTLLGCGFPVRGTSFCMFQWVRRYPDGTWQYIEGATNPEYAVTADDIDKIIAVECIPMDDQGRQGEIVRLFANDQNKITCDPDMQMEIEDSASKGHATFSVSMLLEATENWQPVTLHLRQSNFQVKADQSQATVITGKFSRELLIEIPNGLSAHFMLTWSGPGASGSYFFSTNNDLRVLDTLVLTMRLFQSKYIEGATNPEYAVTADDVDKIIAVECIPKDDQGRQGEIVRLSANDQNKITCALVDSRCVCRRFCSPPCKVILQE